MRAITHHTPMLINIQATFACDECGDKFVVKLDPASTFIHDNWSLFDEATDAVAGGVAVEPMDDPTSVQNDKHLCGACTAKADARVKS